jgi:hypothetical protein
VGGVLLTYFAAVFVPASLAQIQMFGLGLLLNFISVILFVVFVISLIAHVSEWRQRTRMRRPSREAGWPLTPPSRQRDLNWQPFPEDDQTSETVPAWVADPNQNIPDWLVPLLRDRSAAMEIHSVIESSSDTAEEAESQLQTRIDDLDTEIITVYQHRQAKASSDKVVENSVFKPITEAEIEKNAVLDLLGALELQWQDGKISRDFYQRKRTQLRKRLAKAEHDTK